MLSPFPAVLYKFIFLNDFFQTGCNCNIEVKLKDNAAINWCGSASSLTKDEWKYLKVPQKEFEKLNPDDFEELLAGINPPTGLEF